jgi:hypothetical protein
MKHAPITLAALLLSVASCAGPTRISEAEVEYVLRTELPLRQELYRAAHGSYAKTWQDLAVVPGAFAAGPSGQVRILIHAATADGWSASTSDRRGGGPVCVMYHGQVQLFPMGPNGHIPPQPDSVECSHLRPRTA